MRTAPHPTPFATFRAAAIEAELAGKTIHAMTLASTSITSTVSRLQRLVESVTGVDEQPAPSPFEAYRSRRVTTPQGQVLPTQGPARGAWAAQDLSDFGFFDSPLPFPFHEEKAK